MDKTFNYVVGSLPLDQQVEFRALSVYVDNPTNQWVRLDSLGVTVPQFTLGAIYPLPGTLRAQASFTAPAGQTQPPIVAGQSTTLIFYDMALPLSAGVGMLGGRAQYYDRNPTPVVNAFNGTVGPHATTTRFTYTVTTAKRAYLQRALAQVIRVTVAAPVGQAVAQLFYTPSGGTAILIALPEVWTNAIGDRDRDSFAATGLMNAGDTLVAKTADSSTGGTVEFQVSAWVVEFDG